MLYLLKEQELELVTRRRMKQSFDLNEKGRLNFTVSLVVSFHKDWQYALMGKEKEFV